jgi:hypothetical protein
MRYGIPDFKYEKRGTNSVLNLFGKQVKHTLYFTSCLIHNNRRFLINQFL